MRLGILNYAKFKVKLIAYEKKYCLSFYHHLFYCGFL